MKTTGREITPGFKVNLQIITGVSAMARYVTVKNNVKKKTLQNLNKRRAHRAKSRLVISVKWQRMRKFDFSNVDDIFRVTQKFWVLTVIFSLFLYLWDFNLSTFLYLWDFNLSTTGLNLITLNNAIKHAVDRFKEESASF